VSSLGLGWKEGQERGFFELELLQVASVVIEFPGLPTPEEDANPFERQGAYRGVVAVALVSQHGVIGLSPVGRKQRAFGKLVERLPQELGRGEPRENHA